MAFAGELFLALPERLAHLGAKAVSGDRTFALPANAHAFLSNFFHQDSCDHSEAKRITVVAA